MSIAHILKEKGSEVVTLPVDVTLADVAKTLAEKRIGAIVLTDKEGVVAGIVSERDVVRMIGQAGPACLDDSVRDAMTMEVQTCTESTTLDQAMAMMTHGRFRHIPVIKDGKLAGIVSIGDIVKYKIAAVEEEADQLREYIAAG